MHIVLNKGESIMKSPIEIDLDLNDQENPGVIISLFIGLYLLITSLIGLWTQSNINQWADYFGKEQEIGFLLSWLLSILLSPIILILNVVSEVLQVFI